VDTNRDGRVTVADGSPYVPDFSRPLALLGPVDAGDVVTVDVTAALQAGAGMYTLAVVNGHTNGGFFASREGVVALRPLLEVEVLPGGECTTDTDCDDGLACTIDACDEASGSCVAVPDDGDCDDGDECTADVCTAGVGCEHPASGRCAPVALALEAAADTYIEAGAQATWDHGAAALLKVDTDPRRVIYLKFDLSAVAGTVTEGLLTLHCTDFSPDGGTVYPVVDSGWVEGDRSGTSTASVGGPGLTWAQVDTNRDGRVTVADGSPYVPDLSRPLALLGPVDAGDVVTVDVTAALQAGAGMYTLAVVNGHTNGGFFASREAALDRRPLLRLTVAASNP
jgi:hypothetical protein